MNKEFRQTIYDSLKLRETEDLLLIWQNNDRVEWEDSTFEILKKILLERLAELPPQNAAIYAHEETTDPKAYGMPPDMDLDKYLDPANAPEFYNPGEVLLLAKMMKQVSLIVIGIIILQSLFSLSFLQMANNILSFFNMPMSAPSWGLIFSNITSDLSLLAGLILSIILYYLPLKALRNILKILMEMEFRSRGVE
jgi:hypothetical protein